MKIIIGTVSLFFLVTVASAAQQQELCNLRQIITNETWYMQTLYGLVQGNTKSIKCVAGCLMYTLDKTLGPVVKGYLGFTYGFFEQCINTGKQNHDTCRIMDCFQEMIVNAYRMIRSSGITIPFQNILDKLPIFHQYSHTRYEVVPGPADLERTVPPVLTTTPPPPPSTTVAPTAIEHKSRANSLEPFAGVGLLSVFGVLILTKLLF